MPTTLPSLTRTIDTIFTTSWYEIRPEAVDNILQSTLVWAMLKTHGCFKTQTGGLFITRPIVYATQSSVAVGKGDNLPTGEVDTETMARWQWRYQASHVQRSIYDDQKNAGPTMIKSLVGTRLKAAMDGMEQDYETNLLGTIDSTEVGKGIQGFNDMVPLASARASGTYGAINRPTTYTNDLPTAGNTWWSPKYKQLTAPIEVNLLDDMRNLYNSIFNNQKAPTHILTTQALVELYEGYAVDAVQIVKDEGSMLADLGFDVLRFKGKPMVWSPNMTANNMLFLNLDFVEAVYDPTLWFRPTEWKDIGLQAERIMHIMSAINVISDQLRRHGRLYA